MSREYIFEKERKKSCAYFRVLVMIDRVSCVNELASAKILMILHNTPILALGKYWMQFEKSIPRIQVNGMSILAWYCCLNLRWDFSVTPRKWIRNSLFLWSSEPKVKHVGSIHSPSIGDSSTALTTRLCDPLKEIHRIVKI